MEITEVRVKLMEDPDDRLQAFCSITLDDCFVVRDLKIIEGSNGPFVAMPSRKLTAHCPQCGCKNHLRAAYCNQCGLRLKEDSVMKQQDGRAKLYADIAHPINSACREQIQERVIAEYHAEQERAGQPGYVSRYDDDYDLLAEAAEELLEDVTETVRPKRRSDDEAKSSSHDAPNAAADATRTHAPHGRTENRPHTGGGGGSRPGADKPRAPRSGDFGAGIF